MNSKQEAFSSVDHQNTIVPAIPMEFHSQERNKEAGKFCPHAGVVSRASPQACFKSRDECFC
ncbi:hypothetical protein V202x_39410 [Gimesia aquarii]|uniref:Uncharacterized protein n=1 Tax=Gimesia aquarii TaxID=2527964 RepID=A0A517WZ52_9PLAN|nr:hypothetical protein V202x_39410 [Gimesia aquarii]